MPVDGIDVVTAHIFSNIHEFGIVTCDCESRSTCTSSCSAIMKWFVMCRVLFVFGDTHGPPFLADGDDSEDSQNSSSSAHRDAVQRNS